MDVKKGVGVRTGLMRDLRLGQEQLSFPSLKLLCIESLHVEISDSAPGEYAFFPDRITESHEPFLAACDRVAGLLRRRPIASSGVVSTPPIPPV